MTTTTDASAPSWLSDDEATDAHRALRAWVREYKDLAAAARLAGWDQQTKLPPKGQAGRGRTMGALSALLHERATSPELDKLISAVEDVDPDGPEARVARRGFDLSTKLPSSSGILCRIASSEPGSRPPLARSMSMTPSSTLSASPPSTRTCPRRRRCMPKRPRRSSAEVSIFCASYTFFAASRKSAVVAASLRASPSRSPARAPRERRCRH